MGTYTVTSYPGDAFIMKLDNSGNFLWANNVGAGGIDNAMAIALDNNGSLFIAGTYENAVDFDPGPGSSGLTSMGQSDVFILKLDTQGNFIWVRENANTAGADYTYAITTDPQGNVYCSNFSSAAYAGNIFKYTPPGVLAWSNEYAATTFAVSSMTAGVFGNLYVLGKFDYVIDFDADTGTTFLSSSNEDIFILKLDTAGSFTWARQLDPPGISTSGTIIENSLGAVYLSGTFAGQMDADPGAGTFNLTSAGTYSDLFFIRLNAAGDLQNAFSVGSNGSQVWHSDMALTMPGDIVATGAFNGTVDFDPGTTVNTLTNSNAACFVAKYLHPLSVTEVENDASLSIYPNPATEQLTIKTEKQYTSFTISNSIGQIMLKNAVKVKESRVDIKSLAPGIYYLDLKGESGTEVRKFVKM